MPVNTRPTAGYSLIELLVVISIVAMLSSLAFSTYEFAQQRARDAQRFADMRAIENALRQFYIDNQRYPGTPDDVSTGGELIGVGNDIDDALRPYIDPVPRDPLHNAGSGDAPNSGAFYFYSYDAHHNISLENCGSSFGTVSDPREGAMFSFHRTETYPHDTANRMIDTCHGSDNLMNDAFFNKALDVRRAY